MYFNETEESLMAPFLHYFNRHSRDRVVLEWADGTRILTRLDTAYDSMNDLDEEKEGFEEYVACIMETIQLIHIGTAPVWDFRVGGLFEIHYHNFPDVVRDAAGNLLLEKCKLLAEQ